MAASRIAAALDNILGEVLAQLGELSDETIDILDPADGEEHILVAGIVADLEAADDFAGSLRAAVLQRSSDWRADHGIDLSITDKEPDA
jgi:hypothetical protein